MGKKLTITVEIDGDRKEIVVRDSAGNIRHLKSVLVTGGGVEEGSFTCSAGILRRSRMALAKVFDTPANPLVPRMHSTSGYSHT